MFANCPFKNHTDAQGNLVSGSCTDHCALNVSGKCTFVLIAKYLSDISRKSADVRQNKPEKEE